MSRHTKIIATLGPACFNESMLHKMMLRGMDVARINFSHGSDQQHQKLVDLLRSTNRKFKFNVKLLQDLAGYRIRLGNLKRNVEIKKDQVFYMSADPDQTDNHIPFDYEESVKDIKRGFLVFIDDGRLTLQVIGHAGKKLKLKVVQGGVLKDRKGVNIPALKLRSDIMTPQDRDDLAFGLKNKMDFFAQSFVRNRQDIERLVDLVKPVFPDSKVIAKIESAEGVRNLDSILDACDGVMVARGDLGVILPLYKIPVIQKYIIRHCARKKKIAITATQMLESMITAGRPTRAEVSDVANAILDGTDYVMLSGETSVGKYPSRSIHTMRQIIEYTEKYQDFRPS